MKINHDRLRQKVREYQRQISAYTKYAAFLKKVLEAACKRLMPYAIVEARPKTIASVAEKLVRKQDKYDRDPDYDMTDRCGARVVTQTAQEKSLVCNYIRKQFEIDEVNSVDKATGLKEDQFGYLAVHFVVQIRDGVKEMEGVPLPHGIVTGKAGFKAEIQVKTLLEHAWAMPLHDRLYKVAIQPPAAVKRDAAGLMALVEAADLRIGHLAQQVDSFLGHYAAYLKPAKLAEEIAIATAALEAVTALENKKRAVDPAEKSIRDAEMALLRLRLGRLLELAGRDVDALAEWKKGRAVASASRPALDLEYGSMLCRQHRNVPKTRQYIRGMKLLHEVTDGNLPESDVDTPAQSLVRAEAAHRLAWAYGNQRGKEHDARHWYRKALALDPRNPYYLADYLAYEVFLTRNSDSVLVMRDYVTQAIAACRQHVKVGIEQPRAQFTMGRLHLLLDEEAEALDAYLKAISILMERDSYVRPETLDDERGFLRSINLGKPLSAKHDLIDRLLNVAHAAKQLQTGQPHKLHQLMSQEANDDKLGKPQRVLVIVGGAGHMPPGKAAEYKYIVEWALEHADELVCSGGTRVGIPGVVGDVTESLKKTRKFKLVAYVPKNFPKDGPPDLERYDLLISTAGDSFGPLQPIQGWVDMLGVGIKPEHVRVLGIEGGKVSAVEYRLALALGAKVAVIPDSGREADVLLRDPDWAANSNLVQLHKSVIDQGTMRAFVRPAAITIEPPERIDELARLVHERYLRGNLYSDVDPVRRKYADLRDDLKASNREQILYAAEILASQGYEVKYTGDPGAIIQPPLDPEKVKRMAELEHGRWNIERLASGWKPGNKKDPVGRINPSLLPWDKLPENIQQFDFNAIGDYAALLQLAGYEIVDKNPDG